MGSYAVGSYAVVGAYAVVSYVAGASRGSYAVGG
jgi:hypothetical protein